MYIQPVMTLDQTARHIAAQCLAMRSRRMARSVSRVYDDALRPVGISTAQLGLLVVIQRRGGVSPAVLGRTLDIEKSTLSRNLRRLRDARLIHEPAEAAGKRLTLTAAGRRAIVAAYPLWREAQRSAHRILGEDLAGSLIAKSP